jgi:hypothetical protein
MRAADHASDGAPLREDETGLALAKALRTDLIFRLDLMHQAGASKLILAAVLMDLALRLTEAERGAAAEEMVRSFMANFLPNAD